MDDEDCLSRDILQNEGVFYLYMFKQQGLEKFVESQLFIKQEYFKGKMMIGKGPQVEEKRKKK